MKMVKVKVPDYLLTDSQKAYHKELRKVKKEVLAIKAFADNPQFGTTQVKDMLRVALFKYSELLKNPPKRATEELAQQPTAGEEEG